MAIFINLYKDPFSTIIKSVEVKRLKQLMWSHTHFDTSLLLLPLCDSSMWHVLTCHMKNEEDPFSMPLFMPSNVLIRLEPHELQLCKSPICNHCVLLSFGTPSYWFDINHEAMWYRLSIATFDPSCVQWLQRSINWCICINFTSVHSDGTGGRNLSQGLLQMRTMAGDGQRRKRISGWSAIYWAEYSYLRMTRVKGFFHIKSDLWWHETLLTTIIGYGWSWDVGNEGTNNVNLSPTWIHKNINIM